MVHDDLPYRAMRELAGVLTDGVNAALAQRDARLDRLDFQYHELSVILREAVTRGEWVPWEWAEDLGVTEPELLAHLARLKRGEFQ